MLETATVPAFARLADFLGPWCIEPRAGAELFRLAQRTDWAAHLAAGPPAGGRLGSGAGVPAGVAVVPILGPTAKGTLSFGGTSTVEARRAIRQAAADPAVRSILLAVDSPGGTVAGTADLAAEVLAARRHKRVVAHVDDLCASAAYWVASQAEAVYANAPTAQVGSIGTFLVVDDVSAAADNAGVRTLVFRTGPLKGAGTPGAPVTDDQRAYFQNMVDGTQQTFDAAVRAGRRLGAGELAAVKTGGVFHAPEAIDLKLIDGVRPLDATLADLGAGRTSVTVPAGVPAMTPTAAAPTDVVPLTPAPPPPDPVAAERQRVADVLRLTAGHPDLTAAAVAEGWSAEDCRRAMLHRVRDARPTVGSLAPRGAAGRSGGVTTQHLAAAVLVRAGHAAAAEAAFGADTLNQLGRLRSASLIDLAAVAIELDGRDVPADRGEMLRAAVSTGTMPRILQEAGRVSLEAAYRAAPRTWASWAAVRRADDFRQQVSVRPTFFGELLPVPPGGDVKHTSFGEQDGLSWRVDTFGRTLSIDRRAIVNDDLGAFTEVLPAFARSDAQTLANLVYKTLVANTGSFFSVGNNNLVTGGAYALSVAGLTEAVLKLRQQTDADGSALDLVPVTLLVPPELETPARQLLASQQLARDGSDDQQPTGNPFAGGLRLEVEPRLSNSAYTGASATAYYLFAGPADVPGIVGFLDGRETPVLETFGYDADPNKLAVTFRVYHDFGYANGDPKAAVKVTGA